MRFCCHGHVGIQDASGIIGMFIGVPCFAVIYMAVKEFVNYRLKKKEIDLESISREMKKEALEIEERMEQLEE